MVVTINTVVDHVKFWADRNKLDGPPEHDIFAFIGPTKSGKSTLINCLLKKRLIVKTRTDTGDSYIVKAEEWDGGPKIGEGLESESQVPKCYGTYDDTGMMMWDFPGFVDNKGVKQEVANAIAMKTVLCQQKSMKFILVVPFETIKSSNPFEFYKLLNSLLMISPNIAQHLILVASKMERGNLKAVLSTLINTPFDNADAERLTMIEKAKSMINVLIDNEAMIEFKMPIGSQISEKIYIFPNAHDFYQRLSESEGINVSTCNLILSYQAEICLKELYDCVYACLRSLIGDIVADIKSKAVKQIETMKNLAQPSKAIDYGKEKINEYRIIKRNGRSLTGVLMNVGTPELKNKASALLMNFKRLESLRNSLSGSKVRGEKEFQLTLIKAICDAMFKLDAEVTNINSKVKLHSVEENDEIVETNRQEGLLRRENERSVGKKIVDFCSNHGPEIRCALHLLLNVASITVRLIPTAPPTPPPGLFSAAYTAMSKLSLFK